jgi:hypothetical protein
MYTSPIKVTHQIIFLIIIFVVADEHYRSPPNGHRSSYGRPRSHRQQNQDEKFWLNSLLGGARVEPSNNCSPLKGNFIYRLAATFLRQTLTSVRTINANVTYRRSMWLV